MNNNKLLIKITFLFTLILPAQNASSNEQITAVDIPIQVLQLRSLSFDTKLQITALIPQVTPYVRWYMMTKAFGNTPYSDVPTNLTIRFEPVSHRIIRTLTQASHEEKTLHSATPMLEFFQSGFDAIDAPMIPEYRWVEDLLNALRPLVKDKKLRRCLKVRVFESTISNAFNTGCHTFFSTQLLANLDHNPDYIQAVLAHEISHGIYGHVLKELFFLLDYWPRMIKPPHMTPTLHQEIYDNFPSRDHELEADAHGADLLLQIGKDPNDLIEVLMRMGSSDTPIVKARASRPYPTLSQRKQAIHRVRNRNSER